MAKVSAAMIQVQLLQRRLFVMLLAAGRLLIIRIGILRVMLFLPLNSKPIFAKVATGFARVASG